MASILNLITIGEKKYLVVDADPSAGGGTEGEVGSLAVFEDNSNVGKAYLKVGPLDTDWSEFTTTSNLDFNIEDGNFLNIPIYSEDPNGRTLDDQVEQNSQNIELKIEAQPARTEAIEYIIPNPGNDVASAEFVLTEGDQLISGDKTFEDNLIVNGDLSVNGTLTYLNSTNTEITDKLVTLNKDGAADSAGGAGLEFEEDDTITGYMKVSSDREGFDLNAPAIDFDAKLDLSELSANREFILPDESGTVALGTGEADKLAIWDSENSLKSDIDLHYDSVNKRLGVGESTPTETLHIDGGARITDLEEGVVKSDANGVLSHGDVDLTSEVTGTLPVANGGTNSSTALSNNRVMVSSSGSIVEASALANGELLIGSTGNAPVAAAITGTTDQVTVTNGAGSITLSLPQDIATNSDVEFNSLTLNLTEGSIVFVDADKKLAEDNANFFWDNTNDRLGLGTNTPTRTLDVNGNAVIKGPLRLQDATASNTNFEMFQAQVSTTNATVTTIASVAVPIDSVMMIKAKIVGKRTGGTAGSVGDSAVYERTARFKNISGTVTRHNLQSDYTSEDQGIFDGTIIVSSTNASIQVRGAANNNMDWIVTYEVSIL